jgi:signal transduction histidine kinase
LIQSDPQESKALLLEAKQLSSQALKDVRQSVATLRTSPFQNQSFEEAIARLMEEFQRSMGYTPHRKIQLDNPISKDIKIALYRIVQEALTNICKYACATEVTIQIQSCPNLSLLQLKIEDNGNGFDPTQTTSGFGLQGMRERTLALNGQFEISSAPGLGCKIRAEFPLNL